MNEITNNAIQNAYKKLIQITELNANILGGYFPIIIPKKEYSKLAPYIDNIINGLFKKFCSELSNKNSAISINNICFYSTINPNKQLTDDCFKIIIKQIKNESDEILFDSLSKLTFKYSEEDLQYSLDIIFDILLSLRHNSPIKVIDAIQKNNIICMEEK